jgi:HTH-like domain
MRGAPYLFCKEVRSLRKEREISKRTQPSLPKRTGLGELLSVHRGTEKARYSVLRLCWMLGVSRSGYYAWRSRPPLESGRFNTVLTQKIKTIHRPSRATYGAPRIHAELKALGIRCGRKLVARLMRRVGLWRSLRGSRMRTTQRKVTQ